MRPNVNVIVGGVNNADFPRIYKTKFVSPKLPFAAQIDEPNTKYVIKHNFDLGGETVTVPEYCILEFDGGSLDNGVIVGQDTVYINVGDVDIWGKNLTREGTWREHSGGGGGEPSEYIKDASISEDGNTLTLIKKDETTVTFTPEGGGGSPDKPYDPEAHSGLGRKTLELDGDSNILTQDDFDQENTIYVIAYDFDLDGRDIDIPNGSVVQFEGGSVSNGNLVSHDSVLSGPSERSNDALYGTYYDTLGKYLSYNKKHTEKWDVGYQHGIFLAAGAIVNENLMCQSICVTTDNVFVLCGTSGADGGTDPYYPIILVYDRYYNYLGKVRDADARTHMNDVASDGQYLYVTGDHIIYKYNIDKIILRAAATAEGGTYNDVETIPFAHNPAGLDYDADNEEFCFACDSYIVVTDKAFNEKRRTSVNYASFIRNEINLRFSTTGIAFKKGVMMLSLWLCGMTDYYTDEGGHLIVTWDTVSDKLVNMEYCKTGFNHGEVEGFYKNPDDSDNLFVLYYSSNSGFRTVTIAEISQVNEVYGVNKKFGKAEGLWAKNRYKRVIIDNNPKTPQQLAEIGMRDGSSVKPFTSFESAYLLATGDVNRYEFEFVDSNTPYFIGKLMVESGRMFQLRGNGGATLEGGMYVRGGKISIYNVNYNAKPEYVVANNSCISCSQNADLYIENLNMTCDNSIKGIVSLYGSRVTLAYSTITGGSCCFETSISTVDIRRCNFRTSNIGLNIQSSRVKFDQPITISYDPTIEGTNYPSNFTKMQFGIKTIASDISHREGAITFRGVSCAIDSEKTVWNLYPDNIVLETCDKFLADHTWGYSMELVAMSGTISHLLNLLSYNVITGSVLVHMKDGDAYYPAGDYYWNGSSLVPTSSTKSVVSGIANIINKAEECPVSSESTVGSGIWATPDDNVGVMSHVTVSDAPVSSVFGGINLLNVNGDSNSLTGAKTEIGAVDAEAYSASCFVKGNGKLRFMVGRDAAEPVTEDYIRSEIIDIASTDYEYVCVPLNITEYISEKPSVNVYVYLVGNGNLTVCFPKLEKGSASDFAYFEGAENAGTVKVLSLGDSIVRGWRNINDGFMKYITSDGNYKNISVSGATLSNSYSEVKNIPQQLIDEAASVNPYNPDVIIANGGVNDYNRGIQLGSASSSPVTDAAGDSALNKSTVLGALEHLFYNMTELFPQARRFFMLSHKILDWPTTQNSAGYTFGQLNEAIKSVCTLYDVTYIDVYGTSEIDTSDTKYRADTAYDDTKSAEWKKNWNDDNYVDRDGIHPADYGYKVGYAPIIREAIGNTANSIYDKGEIDDAVNKAKSALQLSDYDEKSAAGLLQTSAFDTFAIMGVDKDGKKYKFNRSFLNEFVRQTRSSDHFTPESNVDSLVRPGIFYGSLNPIPSIFNDGSASSKYHHILIDGDNDVFQIVYRNDHNTLGIRNGSQSGYSKALKPLRTPLVINSATGTSITAYVNNLYRFDSTVSDLTITLPDTDLLYADKVEFVFTTGSTPSITFAEPNSNPIVYQTGYNIEASKTYRITVEWIGNKWIVSYITMS